MDSELATALPAGRHERWFDLCFRLIVIALAGFWLLTPPAPRDHDQSDSRAAATTR